MFSIIIPSFNREVEIASLLDSLSEQTVCNFEVIIVDDCSFNPICINKNYSFPVRIIRNLQNKGVAESRNIGAKNAKNEWLIFLDDDDRFLPEKCEVLTRCITNNMDINFIYHPAECIMVNEGFSYFTQPYKDVNDLTLDKLLLANKIGGMPMIAIKKILFEEIGGLSNKLLALEDYEFILKLILNKDFNPIYISHPLTKCSFYTKRSSVSTNIDNTKNAIEFIRKNYVNTSIQKHNFEINTQYILAYIAMMNLSRKAAKYYFNIFKINKKIKPIIIALIFLISPKLAINLKRFM